METTINSRTKTPFYQKPRHGALLLFALYTVFQLAPSAIENGLVFLLPSILMAFVIYAFPLVFTALQNRFFMVLLGVLSLADFVWKVSFLMRFSGPIESGVGILYLSLLIGLLRQAYLVETQRLQQASKTAAERLS